MGFFLTIAYIVLSYLSPADLFPQLVPYRIMIWVGLLAFFTSLPNIPLSQIRVQVPQTILLLGLMGAMSMSRIANGWFGGAVKSWYQFGITATVFFLVILSSQSLPRVRRLAIVLVLCSVYLVVQGFAAVEFGYREDVLIYSHVDLTGGVSERVRGVGWLGDPNDLAQQLTVVMPFLGLAWRKRKTIQNLLLVIFPGLILLFGVYLTKSRGGLMGILALVFLAIRDRLKTVPAIIATACMLIILLGLSFGGGRALSMSEGSAASRLILWGDGISMFKSHPLFGVGFESFLEYSNHTAHNSFVLAFAELGLVGYFFWLGLLVFSVGQLNQVIKAPVKDPDDVSLNRWAKAIRLSFATFLVTGWFLSRTYIPTLYILIGLAVSISELHRKKYPELQFAGADVIRRWVVLTCILEIVSIGTVYVMIRARGI